MKSRRLAYIVKDTKTYMNVEEARFAYSTEGDQNFLFIVIPRRNNSNLESRMRETVKAELWDEVIWIYSRSNGVSPKQKNKKRKSRLFQYYWDTKEFVHNYLDRKKLDNIAGKYSPCDIVFSAHKNTQEHLAAQLDPDRLILVDSGHRIFKRINSNGFIDYSRWFTKHSRFTRYMHRLTGMKVFDRKKTTLFTVYADEINTNHQVEKNNFEYQNYLLNSKPLGDEVVWISTPIYAMVQGITLDDYISYIRKYVSHLNINPEKLIYIPHPGKQTPEDIDTISKVLHCRTDDRDIPVEFKIANYDQLPRMCISPFSSALVNVNVASVGRIRMVSAWHYEFNFFELWLNWRKDVEKNPELDIEFIELQDCNPLFYIKSQQSKQPIYTNFQDWRAKRKL